MKINFNLNGTLITTDVREDEYLAETLRRLGIYSIKVGCNESACGSCTILVDEKPILSCSYLSMRVDSKSVLTVEGIQEEASIISDYFSDEGADQCGYCASGFALIVHALKRTYENPTDEEIKDFIVGNLCRCSGYQSQFLAIKKFLKRG